VRDLGELTVEMEEEVLHTHEKIKSFVEKKPLSPIHFKQNKRSMKGLEVEVVC
jgi:hypothetical protein